MKSCLVLSHPGKREREREERKSFTFNIEYWREGFDFCLSILSQVFLRSLRASRFACACCVNSRAIVEILGLCKVASGCWIAWNTVNCLTMIP
jgi:hypothetical protein